MTRVVVLLVIAAALLAQLALGTDPILVAFCGLALVVGFFPALVFRPDLYGVLAAFFAIRYVGAALITKTWLMQPLDQYLNAPVAAYGLSCLLMFVVVGVILTVRALDRGTTLFALPENAEAVRLLGLVAFVIGATAYVASGIIVSRESDEAATGLYVLVVILGGIHLLGFVAEILYCALTNRGPFSLRLVVMLVVMFAIAMFLNARSVMFDGVIAIAVSGIVYRVIRARHLVGLTVAAVLASQIVTPITMELRRVKEGKSASEFASAAGEVIAKAVSEPDYVGILRVRQAQEFKGRQPPRTLRLLRGPDQCDEPLLLRGPGRRRLLSRRAPGSAGPLGPGRSLQPGDSGFPGEQGTEAVRLRRLALVGTRNLSSLRSRPSRILACRWKATLSPEPWASSCSRPSSCSRSCSS